MISELDTLDRQLLMAIQADVAIVERPFAQLGQPLGLSEDEVLSRLDQLKEQRIIRQISAIFDTTSLGYESSLVAMKCDPDDEDAVAAIINQHPGVSHNYRRNHAFNLWYTIAVAPTSRLGLAKTVEILHRESGAEVTRPLPTLKLYKIGVQFDLTGESASTDHASPSYTARNRAETRGGLTPQEIEFIRVLQRDLPLTPTPFLDWADELNISLSELQATRDRFAQQGKLRRFAAVLNHRNAGFSANAMGVWAVRAGSDAEVDRIGESMAGFRAVSHCYRRPVYPDWPFNIFTMVHGQTPGECDQVLKDISATTGVREYRALYSTKEYKKSRVRYFSNEEQQWESQRSPQ